MPQVVAAAMVQTSILQRMSFLACHTLVSRKQKVVMSLSQWHFLILVACYLLTSVTAQLVPFENFDVMTSSTGQRLCAVDPPTFTIPVRKANAARCASQCVQYKCCQVYQYNDDVSECQLYSYVPTNVTINKQCKAFRSEFDKIAAFQTNKSNEQGVTILSLTCWIPIMLRMNESFPLHLTWTQHKNAFGDLNNFYYWAGLETIYQITSRGPANYRLRFELLAASNRKWYYAEYDSFYLDSEVKGYALHVSQSAVGDAGDGLNAINDLPKRNINGMKFYTFDKDSTDRCAATYDAGWWFNDCTAAALTAPHYPLSFTSPQKVFRWGPLNMSGAAGLDGLGQLKACRVMIMTY